LDAAAAEATAALRGGWAVDARRRQAALWKWADLLASNTDELVRALVLESGKPVHEARIEVAGACEALRYNSGLSRPMAAAPAPCPTAPRHICPRTRGRHRVHRAVELAVAGTVPRPRARARRRGHRAGQTRATDHPGHPAGIDETMVRLVVGDGLVG
jgi:acyl-CoA reductase-like NAD-dependent aldehyde dehydrogenase